MARESESHIQPGAERMFDGDLRPACVAEIAVRADSAVLADIRQRIADGERSPVLARHMAALGLDDVLLALARES